MNDIDLSKNLASLLFDAADRYPGAPALTEKRGTLSYADLAAMSRAFGRGLADLGLPPGQRIAIYLPKQWEAVAAKFGAAAAGHAFVPVNPALKADQVAYILADSGAAMLLTSPDRWCQLQAASQPIASLKHVALTGRETDAAAGSLSWDALCAGIASDFPTAGGDGLAAILYTSGSTGKPKGVMLSHGNMLSGAVSVAHYLKNSREDRILALLPLSFDYGLSQLTTGFLAGAEVVLHNYLFPKDVVRAVEKHRITGLAAVPPLWFQLADQDWPEEAAAHLRYMTNSGGRMPRPLLDRLRGLFPAAEIYLMYGLTEAFRSTYLDPALVDRRPDSIGKAIPFAEVLVVDAEGRETAPDEAGELVHCGPLVAQGYWRDPARTAERFKPAPSCAKTAPPGGIAVWSGDKVRRDADGFLYFVGRDDEMIKTLGNRISPTEVEEAVLASGLAGEAVAVGIEDERLGQAIAIAATPRGAADAEGTEALLAYCRRAMPGFMVPHYVIWRNGLPHNANGKLDRPRIAAEVKAEIKAKMKDAPT